MAGFSRRLGAKIWSPSVAGKAKYAELRQVRCRKWPSSYTHIPLLSVVRKQRCPVAFIAHPPCYRVNDCSPGTSSEDPLLDLGGLSVEDIPRV